MPRKKSKLNVEQATIVERQFGVVLEHMDKKIDIVLEGHAALDKKIDDFHDEFSGLRNEFSGLRNEFSGFRKDTESNFSTIFEYLSGIDTELKSIRGEIDEVRKFLKHDSVRLEALEKRVHELEIKLASFKHA